MILQNLRFTDQKPSLLTYNLWIYKQNFKNKSLFLTGG